MRLRLVAGVVAFFVLASVLLVAVLVGLNLLSGHPRVTMTTNSVIVLENAHPGTSDWKIPGGKAASTQLQAYASATSVLPGQVLTFYVSTQRRDTPYSVDIYRLGWYGGRGGRLMASRRDLIGHAQGYYDPGTHNLLGCISCLVDAKTGLVEANWQPSYTLTVPANWTTGIYLAKFTDVNGMQTYVPFDVKGNTHSLYVAVTPDTTYAAYNAWGGYSLYKDYSKVGIGSLGRGIKVSFDRPYLNSDGSDQVLYTEADAIHWLERRGYNLSYISNIDLHRDPAQLLQHRAYLSLGHDEYWTKEIRDGVEYARDNGVGLAFLGANASFWQMRFEPDSVGTPNRTIVCYKVETRNNDLARDPLYGKDNTRLTAEWRDPVLARPENALIGIMYSDVTHRQPGFPWRVNPVAKSPLLDGTGLRPGQSYGCGLVGNEWDRVFANGAAPRGLQLLGVSHTVDNWDVADISNTTYYIAPSGALIFASGSIFWTTSLDSYRLYSDENCIGQNPVVPGIQMLMAHVMDALVVRHPSQQLAFNSTT
jgi:hypothetical protein